MSAGRGDTLPLSDVTGRVSGEPGGPGDRLSLVLYHRAGAEAVPLRPGVPVVVGREPPADVVLQEDSLSRRHARFTLSAGEVVVEDLGSTNGTRVAGRRVDRCGVKAGEEIHLGRVTACIHELASAGAPLGAPSHDGLRAAIEVDLLRARHFRRPFALLAVRALDASVGVSQFHPRVSSLLRPVDRVALFGPHVLDVLVPEVSAEEAADLARRISAGSPGAPRLACGVAPFPGAAATAEELLEVAHAAVQSAASQAPSGAPRVVVAATSGARVLSPGGPPPPPGAEAPIVRSPAAKAVFDTAGRLARTAIPILLQGETGTGKEVLARAIHEASPRRGEPLLCVNCGALAESLLESTLFGHEPGAFTGAVARKDGVFQAAHRGTLLLDEVGELSAAAQSRLLRVLESKRLARLGSNVEIDVNVRVIAATHRDLEAMCEAGTFRRDLLFRLNTATLTLPPLRRRREDIAPLARCFLEEANRDNGWHLAGFEAAALEALEAHGWPGNVRELRNAVQHAAVLATGDLVTADDLPPRLRGPAASPPPGDDDPPSAPGIGAPDREEGSPAEEAGGGGSYAARMARMERRLLVSALDDHGWNQTKTARALEMPLRTLQHKIKVLGLRRPISP